MAEDVKRERPGRGQRQVARTEGRVLEAATRLFLDRGYTATTVEDIAEAADVGARTVYVRFATKAALFKRVVDVAIVGDADPVALLGRPGMQVALTAPSADGRIAAVAALNRQILERTGPLFAVAQQAAAVEPLIQEYWQQGRQGLRSGQRAVWSRMVEDGLLDPAVDLGWLIDTASVVMSPETYLLITRMLEWDLDGYEAWLVRTLTHLVGATADPSPIRPSPDRR